MRMTSWGHLLFAVTMAGLGVMGLLMDQFPPVWDPVPEGEPARALLVYLCAFISLASGIGLLWPRTGAHAARLLLACLVLWLLLFKIIYIFQAPAFGSFWPSCTLAVPLASAWILYTGFASDWDRQHLGFICGSKGLRVARVLYGLVLIFFGSAHFVDLKDTVALVPGYLPWHVAWAYGTGSTFIAAGVAVCIGRYARLAAALSAVQIGIFLLLVWIPIVAAGSKDAFQWSETIASWTLMTCAWVVADSYRDQGWFTVGKHPAESAKQPSASFSTP